MTRYRYSTPLRYPGGKQKISSLVADIILGNGIADGCYVEPYAGGAGVAAELLLRDIVKSVHLNDLDPAVHSFWWSVLNKPEELCRRVADTPLTVREWRRQREIFSNPTRMPRLERGFAMFYLNRCNRSGILTAGVIGGLNQKGNYKMDARYNRKDLVRRIELIADRAKHITLTQLDAQKFIEQIVPGLGEKTLVYFDPPYYHKAARLYQNHYEHRDHAAIAKAVQRIKLPWIVSYDATPEISGLYNKRRQFELKLQYSAASSTVGTEILIAKDGLKMPSYLAEYKEELSCV